MKWVIKELKIGDHIRVKRPYYYHHGVYVGEGKVIHYCGLNGDAVETPEEVFVRETSIDFFAQGSIVETAELSFFESLFSRRRKKRVKIAKKNLGVRGYNFLHNNCETFANKCCYTKTLSSQIDDFKKTL